MADFIYDHLGIKRKLSDIRIVGHLETLKKKSGSDPWPVIEECFKVWQSKNPTEWDSYLYYLEDIRETRKDKKFASSTDKVTGGILRYVVDIPQKIMFMIRILYTPDELPMNKAFFINFAKRFPKLVIPEKI